MGDNVEVGVYPVRKALKIAQEMELDLVEISPKASPPVCKILEYKKFLYEQKKREKALKSKATKVIIKEIRFGPQTDEHDYEFKKKHAEKFLKKGRSFLFSLKDVQLCLKSGTNFVASFSTRFRRTGESGQLPKLEGKRMTMFISPKNQNKRVQ